ncbi:glycosyltransferase [Kineococcus endophyticus]
MEAREGDVRRKVLDRLPQRIAGTHDGRQERRLRSALRRLRPDVVHAHFGTDAAVVAPVARELGIPFVITWHGYDATVHDEVLAQSESGRTLLARREELLRDAAGTIAVSGPIARELERHGATPGSIDVIACGVDTQAVAGTPPPPDGGLLFVGRLVEKKGLGDLLDALSGLAAPPPLTVIGDGPLRARMESRAQAAGLDVRFLGVRGSDEVREQMRAAQAVVIPSRRATNGDCEGLPVVSLEAGACARPVVAYAHSGLVESVLDGTTGLLAQEGDVAGLATAIEKVSQDADLREALGRAGRDHVVRSFDIRVTTARIEAVYDRARS